MKTIKLSLLFCLLTSTALYGQWELVSTSLENDSSQQITSISIVDDQTIWAATLNFELTGSQFLRSADGGQNWQHGFVLGENSNTSVFQIQGLDENTAWVSAVDENFTPYLFKTTDAGQNWDTTSIMLAYPGDELPLEFHFFDENTAIAFSAPYLSFGGNPLTIYRTQDGGQTWNKSALELSFSEIRWYRAGNNSFEVVGDTVWMGTSHGRIVRSIDRGANWEIIGTEFTAGNTISSIAFQNAQEGLALVTVTGDLRIDRYNGHPVVGIKTTDGGETWTKIVIPDRIETLEYVPGSDGVFVATIGWQNNHNDHFISKDGGKTWVRNLSPNFSTIQFSALNQGWAGGWLAEGGLYRYTGPTLNFDANADQELFWLGQANNVLADSFVLTDISIIDEQQLWAAVYYNPKAIRGIPLDEVDYRILSSKDGGETWQIIEQIPFVTGIKILDIHAVDDQVIYFSSTDQNNGSGAAIYKTEDGGENWNPVLFDDAANYWLHFFNRNEGFCLWDANLALTKDGGQNWEKSTLDLLPGEVPFGGNTTPLEFGHSMAIADGIAWFGTSKGRIFKSRDQGSTWEAFEYQDTAAFIHSVAFKDSLNGMLVSTINGARPQGHIASTQDGGQTWQPIFTSDHYFEEIVYIPGSINSYVASNTFENISVYTNDGGASWEVIPDVRELGKIKFLNPTTGWAVDQITRASDAPIIYKWNGPAFPASPTDTKEIFQFKVKVFPTPFQQNLVVELPAELVQTPFELSIWDASGRLMQSKQYRTSETRQSLQLEEMDAGIYYLRYANSSIEFTKKIIKF